MSSADDKENDHAAVSEKIERARDCRPVIEVALVKINSLNFGCH